MPCLLPQSATHRAEQKIAEGELHTRHERRLRTSAEDWLILAGVMQLVEARLKPPEPAHLVRDGKTRRDDD
ncbi:MAG TPA: hypothetical protein VGD41_01860 [Pyrinomonadaceae bacterium]